MNEPMETRSTCPYCGVGCGVVIEHDGARILGVRGDPDHPANYGRLCTKGATLHLTARPERRLLAPMLRTEKGATRAQVTWDTAVATAADRFAQTIREHGPDSVAFYLSGQLLTEDYYVFNKLAKGLVGTNNVDTNSRLCMSSAVAAYKQTLGADAPPCAYEDLELADCVLIAGSNAAFAHPVAYRRMEEARRARLDMKVIVVDPRRTDTAAMADLHLPVLPGTDIWLFNAMLHVLVWEGLVDRAFVRDHTSGFDALRDHVRDVGPAVAAEVCGVPAADIVKAARWWGESDRSLSLWCQGLNQSHHGTHGGTALIALSLATGKIGRPGCGPFSLTGQPNAMGGREVGGLANLLSGHRDLADPAHRAEVAELWGVADVPVAPGLTAVELFDAMHDGRVKAVWIACTNPAQSMPEQERVREALARCEFVVLQECFDGTETAPFADLLLPATTWGEKGGTVTNSERRISRVRRAVAAPGEARDDWRIARDFAWALGPRIDRQDATRLFDYPAVEDVFREHVATTVGRDLDIGGLDYDVIDAAGPQQWPFPAGAVAGRRRLYEDGRFATEDGRARFVVPVSTLTAEVADARFPFRLTTGRLRDQWHGMSRTGRVARLHNHVEEPRIELSRADLEARELVSGDLVKVTGRRGEIVLRALASDEIRSGQAFVAMHWGRNALNTAGVNELTTRRFDPFSKQPELKHAAVQVTKAALPWQALIMRTDADADTALARCTERLAMLTPWLDRFAYAALSLAGRDHPAVVLRIAHHQPLPPGWLDELDALLGLDHEDCLSYQDTRRGIAKRARIEGGVLTGVRLTGETAAAAWLRDVMVDRLPTTDLRRWLLAPVSTPPASAPSRGRVVCNCLNVAEREIQQAIATGADVRALQDRLKCGTSCGSCVPELERMVTAMRRVGT